ncbi:sugar phosphate nucleotidyltransferase [Paludibacterium denitrificans]|uniref:sugar phosphate nucleotidyltransferase n=1 Tax=Paludibacterium denitrificans TaxID=2675226 RepID=UPI001E51EF79|nr:sugar phosphate nucleotidyltransferase [Paludibacterium denitrificans]
MINVLIPMAAKSQHFSETEYPFPSPLIEIGKKTVIEHVLKNLESAGKNVQFIFVINNADCRKFHLDSTLNIITNNKSKIIKLENETKGAACSALMAISYIENSQPLLIANPDQIFDEPLHNLIARFGDADA